MEWIAVIIIAFLIYRWDKKQKQRRLEQEVISTNKAFNRNLLNKMGKNSYIEYIGQDAYDAIQNNTDTRFFTRF
jgi:hypothetical protein